jgi:hypothetical protein
MCFERISELAATEATLSAVGTRPYTADQQTRIWDGLKAASEGLKEIIRGMAHG